MEDLTVKCPFAKICNKKIDFNHFKKYCCDEYEECDAFKYKSESEKPPWEWMKIINKE